MNRLRVMLVMAASCVVAGWGSESAMAQFYGGYPSPGYGGYGYGSPIYSGGVGLGVYGAHSSWGIGVPSGSYYGIGAYPSSYSPGSYTGAYYGSPYGYSGYAYRPSYSPGYGYGGRVPVYVTPAPVLGTTTTIIRGGPTGGVVQYSNNGNGYSYSSDSSYPSVVTQSPVIGPSRTYVIDGPRPVVVESRPSNLLPSNALPRFTPSPPSTAANIKLSCPKTAPGPLSYTLNGHAYTINPGYSQTFPNDRAWTIEFKRGGDDSEVASYALNSGLYSFVAGPSGWDLQQPGAGPAPAPSAELLPAPLPPAPLPAP